MAQPEQRWSLSATAWRRLLAALGENPDTTNAAAEAYEALRKRLVIFFLQRQFPEPETLADTTIDRLARKLQEDLNIRDLTGYALGVARIVALETRREQARQALREPELKLRQSPGHREDTDQRERLLACLEHCLHELPAGSKDWLLDYYRDSGQIRIQRREAIARQLGLGLNALRIRACRLRDRLESCIAACAARKEAK